MRTGDEPGPDGDRKDDFWDWLRVVFGQNCCSQARLPADAASQSEEKTTTADIRKLMTELQATHLYLQTLKDRLKQQNEEVKALQDQLKKRNADSGAASSSAEPAIAALRISEAFMEAERRQEETAKKLHSLQGKLVEAERDEAPHVSPRTSFGSSASSQAAATSQGYDGEASEPEVSRPPRLLKRTDLDPTSSTSTRLDSTPTPQTQRSSPGFPEPIHEAPQLLEPPAIRLDAAALAATSS